MNTGLFSPPENFSVIRHAGTKQHLRQFRPPRAKEARKANHFPLLNLNIDAVKPHPLADVLHLGYDLRIRELHIPACSFQALPCPFPTISEISLSWFSSPIS